MFGSSLPLKKFDQKEYYFKTDAYRKEESKEVLQSVYLLPRGNGVELVAQYYREKYNADIMVFRSREEVINYLATFNPAGNTRKAFIVIEGDEQPHAIPIIYIKENGEEGVLFADSKGMSPSQVEYWGPQFKKPFYFVEEQRQLDRVSCYVDALTFSRDAVGIDPSTKEYIEPDLLKKLKSRRKLRNPEIDDGIYRAKLPNGLLKVPQIESFVEVHRETEEEKTEQDNHPRFSIKSFRETNTDKGNFIVTGHKGRESKLVNPANYLRTEGLKLVDIIQIQFYMNQLRYYLKDSWTTSVREQFIEGANETFLRQPELYEFANKFLTTMQHSGRERASKSFDPMPFAVRCGSFGM